MSRKLLLTAIAMSAMAMSPALVRKYLDAARRVASHLLLTPDGARFAPHPVVVVTDRDKYAVKRIVEFYARQPTDLAAYFAAAWRGADGGSKPPDAGKRQRSGIDAPWEPMISPNPSIRA